MSMLNSSLHDRCLEALSATRVGFHFPGHFLGIRWIGVEPGSASLAMPSERHFQDERGLTDVTALAVLADTALSTAVRSFTSSDERLGTTQLQLQFTGASAEGEISAHCVSHGKRIETKMLQSMAAGTLCVQGKDVCFVSGEFAHLAPSANMIMRPLPWQSPHLKLEELSEDALTPVERRVLSMCDSQEDRLKEPIQFLRSFWCGGQTKRDVLGRYQEVKIDAHMGNRVGDVQGGIMLGIAATVAREAAPSGMSLANITMWYAKPGRGAAMVARPTIIHAGENTALVHTILELDNNSVSAVAISQHVAMSGVANLM